MDCELSVVYEYPRTCACALERGVVYAALLPYIERTTIRARAANKHCLTLTQLRFLHFL